MDNLESEPPELTSWKEIAAHLGVSVRAVQRWELEKGLPVRRFAGERGRVSANAAELDRWKKATLRPRWWVSLKFLRVYAAVSTVMALTAAGLVLAGFLANSRHGPPARFRLDFKSLVVMDEGGTELWRKSFEDTFQFGQTPEIILADGRAWFGDLDGDGRIEMLFGYAPASVDKRGSVLICLSDTGTEKWRFVPGRTVSTITRTYEPPFVVRCFRVLRYGRDNQVLVSSHHLALYPTQVAALSNHGRLLGEYWHSGHLNHLDVSDLDGNGTELVILAGISNGYRCATAVVLDPRDLGGASLEKNPEYQLRGFGPGRERARILFPRTCINRKFEEYNWPNEAVLQGGVFRVGLLERRSPAGEGVIYRLNRRLELIDVELSDSLRAMHRQLEAAGQLDHPLTEAEAAELRNITVLRPFRPTQQH